MMEPGFDGYNLGSFEELGESSREASPTPEPEFRTVLKTEAVKKKQVNRSKKEHTCPICNKQCSSSSDYHAHMRIHNNVNPYDCAQCGKKFTQKSNLKSHETTHLQEKPHVCDICGKSFSRKTHLRSHRALHDSDSNFKCEKCRTNFKSKNALDQHSRKSKCSQQTQPEKLNYQRFYFKLPPDSPFYKEEATFFCFDCPLRFFTLEKLNEHTDKYHPNQKTHLCELCFTFFKYKREVMDHKIKFHPEEAKKQAAVRAAIEAKNKLEQESLGTTSATPLRTISNIEEMTDNNGVVAYLREGECIELDANLFE